MIFEFGVINTPLNFSIPSVYFSFDSKGFFFDKYKNVLHLCLICSRILNFSY